MSKRKRSLDIHKNKKFRPANPPERQRELDIQTRKSIEEAKKNGKFVFTKDRKLYYDPD